jgi:hypothetical protein
LPAANCPEDFLEPQDGTVYLEIFVDTPNPYELAHTDGLRIEGWADGPVGAQ